MEPAESPLTPESWGKLGMWIFLAGDAVGFGTLLAAYGGMRATSADWPIPYDALGINLTAVHDLPPHLLQRHDGEGVGVAGRGGSRPLPVFLFFTALGGALFVTLQAYEWSNLIHEGLSSTAIRGGLPLRDLVLHHHRLPRTARDRRGHLPPGHDPVRHEPPDPAASYNAVEISGLYWHFVDLVWIMVFTFMYLL